MNLKHDEDFLQEKLSGAVEDGGICNADIFIVAQEYHEHMQRFHPASDWHEDDGDVLWYRLPVAESPYVGSPLDEGWDDEPFAILLNGETRAEYFTHFQHIHTPEH